MLRLCFPGALHRIGGISLPPTSGPYDLVTKNISRHNPLAYMLASCSNIVTYPLKISSHMADPPTDPLPNYGRYFKGNHIMQRYDASGKVVC